jgi:polynucleotide 5'-hydroxyl-kinase GRC3/NOL9
MNLDLSGHGPWEEMLEKVRAARVTMVIGAVDTGKTSLVTSFADGISTSGRTCGIVDADMGQSDIGPPTTIGLGGVCRANENASHIDEKGIYFVGAPSPKGHLLPTVVGTKVMVDKALKLGFDHILVDTTGLVHGHLGETLKGHKVELIKPDLLIVLQRQKECEHLIRRFRAIPTRDTIVLTPSEEVRRKSPAERRAFRERALLSYFSNSSTSTLNLKSLSLIDSQLFRGNPFSQKECTDLSKKSNMDVLWAESLDDELHLVTRGSIPEGDVKSLSKNYGKNFLFTFTLDEFENILIGLYDKEGSCYSLGIIRSIDFPKQRVEIEVAEDRGEPCGIKFSRLKISHNGSGEILPPKRPIRLGSSM